MCMHCISYMYYIYIILVNFYKHHCMSRHYSHFPNEKTEAQG